MPEDIDFMDSTLEALSAENAALKKKLEAFEAEQQKKQEEARLAVKKEEEQYRLFMQARSMLANDALKSINFPSTSGQEKWARFEFIKIDKDFVVIGRQHAGFRLCDRRSNGLDDLVDFPIRIEDLENGKWAYKFNLCPQCRTYDESEEPDWFEAFYDKITDVRTEAYGFDWTLYRLSDSLVREFHEIWSNLSLFPFTHDCKECRYCNGVKNDLYLKDLSRYLAHDEDMLEFEKKLRKYAPHEWDHAKWIRDAPKREEQLRIAKEKDAAYQAALKLRIEKREAKKKATALKNRNNGKLSSKKLKFISRIGMASKLNQICKH